MNKKTVTIDDIIFISTNDDGNYYIGFEVPTNRSINRKGKNPDTELLVYGFHRKHLKRVLTDLVKGNDINDIEEEEDESTHKRL